MKSLKLFILVASIALLPTVANAQVKELNERQLFEKVCSGYGWDFPNKNDKPCVVLFHNGTCPFAKQIGKYLETLAEKKEYKDKVYFYKVNVWNLSDKTLEDFNFEGVPQTYFFRGIDDSGTYEVGMLSMNELEEEIRDFLLGY